MLIKKMLVLLTDIRHSWVNGLLRALVLPSVALFLTSSIGYAQAVPVSLTVVKSGNGAGSIASSPTGIDCGADCSEFYTTGVPVTLTATAATGSTFQGWQGACSGAGAVCTLTLNAATAVTATFTLNQYQFTASKAGNGAGKINSTPAGIDCGNDCSEFYAYGALVTLTANAEDNSTFAGWVGACTGRSATCVVSIDGAKQATAIFILNYYPLAVSRNGNGVGKITGTPSGIDCGATCSTSYPYGTVITLTAAAGASSTFSGWQGACTGTTTTCVVSINAAKEVTGIFTLKQYTISVSKRGAGAGHVSSTPDGIPGRIDCGSTCAMLYNDGTEVRLTATPAANSLFTGWQGACANLDPVCVITVDSAQAITVTFALKQYEFTVMKLGTGAGAVNSQPPGIDCGSLCRTLYAHGTVVTLAAAPTVDSTFSGWQGSCSGTLATCAVTVDAAKTVTATFTRKQYDLTVARRGDGAGVVTSTPPGLTCGFTCVQRLNHGTLVTLTATAALSATFSGWQGACTGTTITCTITIDAPNQVTATFALKHYNLTVVHSGNGVGNVTSIPPGIACGLTCTQRLAHGTLVTLTATAAVSSTFTGWQGACVGTRPSCAVTVDAAKQITATFLLNQYNFVVTKAGNGDGRVTSSPTGLDCGVTCTLNIQHGAIITLTAQPTTTSFFAGWQGACTGTQPTCQVTLASAKAVTATFTLKEYDVTINKIGNGAGAVTSTPPGIDCGPTCTQRLTHGAVVTLTATAAVSSTFTGWRGACVGSGQSCVVIVAEAKSITASFSLNRYDLIVTKGGGGGGQVVSHPGGIDCGLTCKLPLDHGAIITLTARPGDISRFVGWSGACAGISPLCQVTMTSTQQITATFAPRQYALTVLKGGSGVGNVTSIAARIACGLTCTATIDHGTLVTLTATADPHSFFAGWLGACTGVAPCVVTLDGAKELTASFTREPIVSLSAAITTTPPVVSAGQVITYHYRITNTGELSVTLQATSAKFGAPPFTLLTDQTPLSPTTYLPPGQAAVAYQVMTAPRCNRELPLTDTLVITGATGAGITLTTQVSVTTVVTAAVLPPQSTRADTIYIGCAIQVAFAPTAAAQQETVDLVVIRGPAPAGFVLHGVQEIAPYDDAFGLQALINTLLRAGCADGRVCHTVRQMTIEQGNTIQVEIIEGLTLVHQLFLPLIEKRR